MNIAKNIRFLILYIDLLCKILSITSLIKYDILIDATIDVIKIWNDPKSIIFKRNCPLLDCFKDCLKK